MNDGPTSRSPAVLVLALALASAPAAGENGPAGLLQNETRQARRPALRRWQWHFQIGKATWYGLPFHGRVTASGEQYDMFQLTAAHPSLPMGSRVRVTRLGTSRSVVVRINDRGPNAGTAIIDLSYAAAGKLGLHLRGQATVGLDVLQKPTETALLLTSDSGDDSRQQ